VLLAKIQQLFAMELLQMAIMLKMSINFQDSSNGDQPLLL
jgi:hypothetical protein